MRNRGFLITRRGYEARLRLGVVRKRETRRVCDRQRQRSTLEQEIEGGLDGLGTCWSAVLILSVRGHDST